MKLCALIVIATVATSSFPSPVRALTDPLPAPASDEFCIAVQQRIASTALKPGNTVFKDMPSFRHSKSSAEPFEIYQVVTYAGQRPIVVSCKMKTAAILRAVFGPSAAGEQLGCPDITQQIRALAIDELGRDGLPKAADRAARFVIDDNEPYITGRSFLADFPLSYQAPDGLVHLNSPGLFQDYDSWITPLLPKIFQGQIYCHLPTVEYVKALATGEMQPGTVITTADDAPVH
ncbi:MAG: hypothetical protein R3F24_10875 [Gammaproteobacteria bacterium]